MTSIRACLVLLHHSDPTIKSDMGQQQHSHFLQSYKPSSKVSQSIELMGQKLKITEQVLIQDYGFNYCMETLKTHNFAKCIEREGNILTERFLAIDMSVTRIFRSCACGRSNRFMEITFSTTLCLFIHLGHKPVRAVFQGWMKSFSMAKHLDTEYLMHFSVLWSNHPFFYIWHSRDTLMCYPEKL